MTAIQDALDVEDLAKLLGVRARRLNHMIYGQSMSVEYASRTIPKRKGGTRSISCPSPALKSLQRRLTELLAEIYRPPRACVGFRKGHSILDAAEPHVGAGAVLNVDLRDFFPTVHYGRVLGVLRAPPFRFSDGVAKAVAQLCCLDGSLPQGAPSSPILANIVARPLDYALRKLAAKEKLRYTRYADDITFSTFDSPFNVTLVFPDPESPTGWKAGAELTSAIAASGFQIAPEKTTVRDRRTRQEVTGLVVNKKVNVRRAYLRRIRAALHGWKHGTEATALAKHLAFKENKRARYASVQPALGPLLSGKLNFVSMIRGVADPTYRELVLRGRKLSPTFKRCRILDDAVLVLESMAFNLQATGFLVSGLGLVTAAHVFDNAPAVRAYRWDDPDFSTTVVPRLINRDVDIAICTIKESWLARTLTIAEDPTVDQSLVALGFPRWGSGNELSTIHLGRHGGLRSLPFDCKGYLLSGAIIQPGASGSPVVDSRGRVRAIAAKGSYDLTNVDLCVGVSALRRLAARTIPHTR